MAETLTPNPDMKVSDADLETRVGYWMERAKRAEATIKEIDRLVRKMDMVDAVKHTLRQWGEGTDEAFQPWDSDFR